MERDLFKDGLKVDSSKKHLTIRPAYAKIDTKEEVVKIWDYGPDYSSFSEMVSQRKEVNSEKMHAGLISNPGLQFANRGICVAKILTYQGNNYLVSSCKRNSNALVTINGYFGNGVNARLEQENNVPKDINVADSILRTGVIEDLEEFNVVRNGKVLRGEIKITRDSIPVSFTPFENHFQYTKDIKYKVAPLKRKLECLTNLHSFPVVKVNSAEDKNLNFMGNNIGIYFDPFNNCYQIVASVQTSLDEIDFLFQTEDKYRDETGMDTFLYRDGIKLIKLDDKGRMLPEVYGIKKGKLEKIAIENLEVLDPLIPKNPKTETIIARSLPFEDAVEYQSK